jgi:hypothetical protein
VSQFEIYDYSMLERLCLPLNMSKKDINETAFFVLEQITDEDRKQVKSEAAVTLGRAGGLKGGKARANSLTPERRKEIAQKAAAKRWGKE